MRKIPVTMATQHPDNAYPSPFTWKRFVSTKDEIDECYKCFKELGVDEYMWDWEWKFVDEAVIDRLYHNYTDFFRKEEIWKDKFLTFRIPNIWEEVSHKLPRAFMNVIAAENAAKNYKFYSPPIFELILPMTTSAKQLIYIQKKFSDVLKSTKEIFETKSDIRNIEVIPLFETFESMFSIKDILREYTNYLKEKKKFKPEYLRVFLARSDPAMNLWLIPAMISCKVALHNCSTFMKETWIKVYPWIWWGSLPFRWGVNPENIDNVINEYRWIYSLTIQSAFRSDYDIDLVKKWIKKLNSEIPKNWEKAEIFTDEELNILKDFNSCAMKFFQNTVEQIWETINFVASKMPSHRERVQHVGLFGYSREVWKLKLPRAIKFSWAMYSIGVPPEFIGAWRTLREAEKRWILPLVKRCYRNLESDLVHAWHYLNKENLELLSKENKAWKDLKEDIELVENVLWVHLGPDKVHHMIHRNFTSNIFYKKSIDMDFAEDILKAAEIRKSLG